MYPDIGFRWTHRIIFLLLRIRHTIKFTRCLSPAHPRARSCHSVCNKEGRCTIILINNWAVSPSNILHKQRPASIWQVERIHNLCDGSSSLINKSLNRLWFSNNVMCESRRTMESLWPSQFDDCFVFQNETNLCQALNVNSLTWSCEGWGDYDFSEVQNKGFDVTFIFWGNFYIMFYYFISSWNNLYCDQQHEP